MINLQDSKLLDSLNLSKNLSKDMLTNPQEIEVSVDNTKIYKTKAYQYKNIGKSIYILLDCTGNYHYAIFSCSANQKSMKELLSIFDINEASDIKSVAFTYANEVSRFMESEKLQKIYDAFISSLSNNNYTTEILGNANTENQLLVTQKIYDSMVDIFVTSNTERTFSLKYSFYSNHLYLNNQFYKMNTNISMYDIFEYEKLLYVEEFLF